MNDVVSVHTPGVMGVIEQFIYADEELRQFVLYTYYNEDEEPLYVGCSKSFYDAHYFNSNRLDFFDQIKYVGFVFLKDEANMKESKKYYIRARQPKHGRGKYLDLPYLKGCDVYGDDCVVSREEMEKRWREWLGDDDDEDFEENKEFAEWQNKICKIVKTERDLTEEEKRYVNKWWLMDIDDFTLKKAYETTVIRMGSFSWQHMHALLTRWKG